MEPQDGNVATGIGFLVPVSESPTLRDTVEYAAREARATAAEEEEPATLYLVHPAWEHGSEFADPTHDRERSLLEDAAEWAREVAGDSTPTVTVEVDLIRISTYPSGTVYYARELAAYARERNVATVIVDPNYRLRGTPSLPGSLVAELEAADAATVERAPVRRSTRPVALGSRSSPAHALAMFGLTLGFYFLLGGIGGAFDVVTGVATAGLVTGVLHAVTFEQEPRPVRAAGTFARWVLYVPLLLWWIARANVEIAYVILHPKLPIDPEMVRFEAAVWGGLPVTTLANSITLTPGTLTVDTREGEFLVHTLTRSARDELLDGSLERAVRFVFFGRAGARLPSPRERRAEREGGEPRSEDGREPAATEGGESA